MKYVVRIAKIRNLCKVLAKKTERNILLGRSRHRWKDNIKMDLKEIGSENVDSIHLAQDRTQ
jgi:hypothetical protein